MWYKLTNLKIDIRNIPETIKDIDAELKPCIAKHCRVSENDIDKYEIVGKSIDARGRRLSFIYNLKVKTADSFAAGTMLTPISDDKNIPYNETFTPARNLPKNPVIVGSGPAGMFAAYQLALFGCDPVIIDRGYDVDTRKNDLDAFYASRNLNEASNFLIGEGGAGTFSDGKLYTRTRDPRNRYILDTFIAHGAPPEIGYLKRPHIGSDRLPQVIASMRQRIIELGGKFIMGTKVSSIITDSNGCAGVILNSGEQFSAPVTIIGHGLGDRALTNSLIDVGVEFTMKSFQVGCRIEHPQWFIDRNQYGVNSRPALLDAAEYNLVSRPKADSGIASATTFCMCPGGTIIPGMADSGRLSTNGMSNFARDSKFANAAIIVSHPADQYSSPTAAYQFLDSLEQQSFNLGGSDYSAPAQSADGFIRAAKSLTATDSSYSLGLCSAALHELLPKTTAAAIRAALRHFDHKMPGYIKHGTLIGIETNISSPVRFNRDPESLQSSLKQLYIAGEGGGCAGGIMSAAADGLKIAEKVLEARDRTDNAPQNLRNKKWMTG
ncbi:MAG: hypothetical protein L3J71_08955 [Victivallaceae bacterium]|nr:hypothetical protein [Victivallaceae bacterium]